MSVQGGEHPTGKPEAKRLRIENRFWSKVEYGDENECWEWQAAKLETGYGAFGVDRVVKHAHRIAYKLTREDIPDGKQINHECDNRSCVNPNHLYAGTQQDNMRDAVERDRNPSQLSPETVREIRDRYETEDVGQLELADEYGTSQPAVSRIVTGGAYEYID